MRLVCDFSFFLEGFEGGRVSGQGWGGPLCWRVEVVFEAYGVVGFEVLYRVLFFFFGL